MTTPEETTLPAGTSPSDGQTEVVEVNGEQVSLEELKKGYMRQADYTRKTQELASNKQAPQEQTTEDVNAYLSSFLKEKGVLTREELEHERKFDSIMQENPDLKPFGEAIKRLASDEGLAFEDVIEKYNFASKDKLAKAKERGILGDKPQGEKSVMQMTDKEWAEFKAKHKDGSKFEKVSEF